MYNSKIIKIPQRENREISAKKIINDRRKLPQTKDIVFQVLDSLSAYENKDSQRTSQKTSELEIKRKTKHFQNDWDRNPNGNPGSKKKMEQDL